MLRQAIADDDGCGGIDAGTEYGRGESWRRQEGDTNGVPGLEEIRKRLQPFAIRPVTIENLEANAAFAAHEFSLDAIELDILLFVLRYDRDSDLETFADAVVRRIESVSAAVSALIDADSKEVHRRLLSGSALMDSGILSLHTEGNGLAGANGYLRLAPSLRRPMHRPYGSRAEWIEAIVGQPLAPSLEWSDFQHLGSLPELTAAVLTGAAKQDARPRETGINFLIYGPVGTGKTEFAKALAAATGYNIWSVGETDDDGDEPSRVERLNSLRIAQRLLSHRRRSLLLFDEAEDILSALGPSSGSSRGRSKVFLCRLLENSPIPVVWTCNELCFIDPAILRRMTLALEIKTPDAPVRQRIWTRALTRHRVTMPAEAIQRLAHRFEAPPALIDSAARAIGLAGGGEAELEAAISGVLRVIGVGCDALPPQSVSGTDVSFDLELVNCVENLKKLCERLSRPEASRRWSIGIEGVPGTGKSEFARYLAGRIGLDVLVKRASDLLSMWVGGTERAIAGAFAEARDAGKLLVLDEADSLLQERAMAQRGWEVTRVNEMLTWMESHPLPFICTTNFSERLDRATLRRFTFKLSFAPLRPDQAELAFERFFAARPPRRLPDGLSPGNFALVRRKASLWGSVDAENLVEWLVKEVEAKEERRRPIGFCPA